MGLIKQVEMDTGLVLPNAYYRISTVGGCKSNQILTLCLFSSQTAYKDGKACMEQKYYDFTPDVSDGSSNFIKQGYEYIKSLPEFVDSLDI